MPRDDLYLFEIVQACDSVARFLQDKDIESFAHDDLVRSAVLQKLTVIGEAAGGLSVERREAHPEVAWARVRAFRNVAVHEYFAVEWPQVWAIAADRVPVLRAQVFAILRLLHPDLAERATTRRG